MKKSIVLIYLFFIVSFIVGAAVASSSKISAHRGEIKNHQMTVVCRNQVGTCLSVNKNMITDVQIGEGRIVLAPHAALKTEVVSMQTDASLAIAASRTLVRGIVRIDAKDTIKINNRFGDVIVSNGQALIEAHDDQLIFINLSGVLRYMPAGENQYYELPMGYSSFFTHVNKSGVAVTGFPRPADIDPLLKRWALTVPQAQRGVLAEEFRRFSRIWRKSTEQASQWYVSTISRELASLRAEEARQARLKAIRETENKKYQEMFRRRIFEQF